MNIELRALAGLFAGAVCIGFAPICVRLADLGPEAIAFWRLTLATPVLALLWWRLAPRDRPLGRGGWGLLWLAGLAFAGDLAVWHYAIGFTSVANATLLANVAPVFVAVAAISFLGERLNLRYALGLACALGGAVVLVGDSARSGQTQVFGDLLGLATAVFYAVYLVAVAMARRRIDTWTIMFGATAISAVTMWPLAVARGPLMPPSLEDWGILAALALVSHIGGQGLIAWAMAHLPASFSSVGLLLQPVAAALFAWLILAEGVSAWQALGGLVVLAGIAVCRRATRALPVAGRP